MFKRLYQTSLSVLTLSALCLTFAPLGHAQSGSIGGKPANPDRSNSRTESIFVKTVQPGGSVSDAVAVVNNTGATKKISVYSVDSVPSSGGAFACAQAADAPVGVGKWITMSQTSVELLPNEEKDVAFNLSVPANAEPGEQNGCIVLQEDKETTFQGGIGLSFRTAIRVAVLVPGEVKKELSAIGINTSEKKDKLLITPKVKNTGNVSLDTKVNVSLSSLFSTTAKQSNTYPVLRQQATEWNFEFNKPFWGGFYSAKYSLVYDSNTKTFLEGDKSSDTKLKTIDGPSTLTFITPHPVALLVELAAVAAIALGVLAYLRRNKQKQVIESEWQSYTVKESEQLADIAKRSGISWKKLAAANNIKPPYHLKPGQKIKLPKASSIKTSKPLNKS